MHTFDFQLENGTKLEINPPSVRTYYLKFCRAESDEKLFEAVAEICNNNTENIRIDVDYVLDNFKVTDFNRFTKDLTEWVKNTRENDPN